MVGAPPGDWALAREGIRVGRIYWLDWLERGVCVLWCAVRDGIVVGSEVGNYGAVREKPHCAPLYIVLLPAPFPTMRRTRSDCIVPIP